MQSLGLITWMVKGKPEYGIHDPTPNIQCGIRKIGGDISLEEFFSKGCKFDWEEDKRPIIKIITKAVLVGSSIRAISDYPTPAKFIKKYDTGVFEPFVKSDEKIQVIEEEYEPDFE